MIVTIGAWRGVGATSAALLLATTLASESDAWLIEADPAGGSLAGRLPMAPHAIGGLERIAFATDRQSAPEAFGAVAHVVGSLRVVTAPADPFRAFACHHPRVPWAASLRDLPGPVVVDAGRLRGGTPAWPLLELADQVIVVSSPEVTAAVAATEWVQAGGRVSPADPGRAEGRTTIAFVESPGGVAFSRSRLQSAIGDLASVAFLRWEPAAVDLVHRGATGTDRRFRRSGLMAEVAALATNLRAGAGVAG